VCVRESACVCVCVCVCVHVANEDFHEVLVEAGNNSSLVVGDPERNLGQIPSAHEAHTMDKL
jgi:hypothetical protein